jgi:hypothetical protein
MQNHATIIRALRCAVFVALVALVSVSCTTTATTTKPVNPTGKLTVEETVRLHMQHPTVTEWLSATEAQPAYFPEKKYWRIDLKDGWILYTERQDEKGVSYVNKIAPFSNDPVVKQRLQVLRPEYEKAMTGQKQ